MYVCAEKFRNTLSWCTWFVLSDVHTVNLLSTGTKLVSVHMA